MGLRHGIQPRIPAPVIRRKCQTPAGAPGSSQHRGLTVFEGESVLDPAAWPPEPSLLILGMSPDEARSLGRQFGQLAIVVGRRGEPAAACRVRRAHDRTEIRN